jgi:hypothetical protein
LCVVVSYQDNLLRLWEVMHLQLHEDDVYYSGVLNASTFAASFNDQATHHDETRLALLLTSFSLVLLFVGMGIFVMSADKLAHRINVPVDTLSAQVGPSRSEAEWSGRRRRRHGRKGGRERQKGGEGGGKGRGREGGRKEGRGTCAREGGRAPAKSRKKIWQEGEVDEAMV